MKKKKKTNPKTSSHNIENLKAIYQQSINNDLELKKNTIEALLIANYPELIQEVLGGKQLTYLFSPGITKY